MSLGWKIRTFDFCKKFVINACNLDSKIAMITPKSKLQLREYIFSWKMSCKIAGPLNKLWKSVPIYYFILCDRDFQILTQICFVCVWSLIKGFLDEGTVMYDSHCYNIASVIPLFFILIEQFPNSQLRYFSICGIKVRY